MKKEILRINDLNYTFTPTNRLENISLCILEGECVGFLGLTYSGKDLLVQLLDGNLEGGIDGAAVYIAGEKVSGSRNLREKVYRMAADNYLIDDWTVAEYIGLVDTGWLKMLLHGRGLELEMGRYFEELGLEFDVSRRMRDLTEAEKRIVDLIKALKRGAKLVIIEDEFEGMDSKDIVLFADVMKRLVSDRMSVIVSSHSNMIMHLLSDKYIVFSEGRIVKKCAKSFIRNSVHLEQFLLNGGAIAGKTAEGGYAQERPENENIVYGIGNFVFRKRQREDFMFAKGKVMSFLILDGKEKERFFMALSGRMTETGVSYIIDGHRYAGVSPDFLVRHKIVSVKSMGGQDEIFAKMSVEENLLLPSLRKISSLEYISSAGGMARMAGNSIEKEETGQTMMAGGLGINDLISMTLERWYIYNPKALILFEPFIQCDAYGVAIVKSYIKKFAARGTSVVIIKSREEYVEDISDEIVNLR